MSKRWDVVATVEYEKRGGEKGKRYVRCGSAFEGDKGISIKLDSVPIGNEWTGWLSLFEPRDKEDAPKQAPRSDADPDVPF